MGVSKVTINIDDVLKEKAETYLIEYGISWELFLENSLTTILEKYPNDETLKAIEECEDDKNLIGPFYTSNEVIKYLMED